MSGTADAPRHPGRLTLPNGPLTDARGYPELAWLDFWQALADRLAAATEPAVEQGNSAGQ